MIPFAELGVTTNYSFLRGASHAAELVESALELGLQALGVADRNSLAGVVRAHAAVKNARALGHELDLLVGARLVTIVDADGHSFELIAYPQDRAAYGRLSKLLTLGNRRAQKGECHLTLADIIEAGQGQCFIAMPPVVLTQAFRRDLATLAQAFRGSLWLGLSPRYRPDDRARFIELAELARSNSIKPVATNDVLYHEPGRRALQDVLTCIRTHVTIDQAGFRLEANAERHLKDGNEMARLAGVEAVAESLVIARRCRFSLDELCYEYPDDSFSNGETPQALLERLTWEGAAARFPEGMDEALRETIEKEFRLISSRNYAPYFLTVHDLVRFADSRGILCQGRGSAANSVVCYCLGITSVNPREVDLLFERFVSEERDEPPDIDVDFEHERREEVMQYVYARYGRERAGIAATVIAYRGRSAVREVGRVFGLSQDVIGALARSLWGWSRKGPTRDHVREAGLDPNDPRLSMVLELTGELIGFPRHLSQHVGGFVITRGPLDKVVPIGNAAMKDRTFVEWDKDDLDTLGILKIDVLALGMLSCIRRAFGLLERHYGLKMGLPDVPPDDRAVYEMLSRADSVGIFQVESRAQMTMLPRLKPQNFYDLVIEVAIVRPGPIQGGMVHPYLRRRSGAEKVSYPSEALEAVLKKTLGIPLFQEQAMKIAIVGAGFTPAESDRLRRAMATFRRRGVMHELREKFTNGMIGNGYEKDFAERCFSQIEGFGDYGFPESHAASFARLVYVSAWIKCHYPDVFCAAILNSQPMGFYAPAQLVRDAREHGTQVRAPDVNHGGWDCTLEEASPDLPGARRGNLFAVRLGLRQIRGFPQDAACLIEEKRGQGFDSVRQLWLRTGLAPAVIERLADADAFRSIGLERRDALWAVRGLGGFVREDTGAKPAPLPLFAMFEEGGFQDEAEVALPGMPPGEHVMIDYATMRLSLKAHPISFLRAGFSGRGIVPADMLVATQSGRRISLAGLVLVRQRPGTASGVIFATIEDETGIANIIIWPKIFERFRRIVLTAKLLKITGRVQKEGFVIHVVAETLEDWSDELHLLSRSRAEMTMPGSRDFH